MSRKRKEHIYIQYDPDSYEKPEFHIGDRVNGDGIIFEISTDVLCQDGDGPKYRSKDILYGIAHFDDYVYFSDSKCCKLDKAIKNRRKINLGDSVRVYFPNGVVLHTMITTICKPENEKTYYFVLESPEVTSRLKKEILSSKHDSKWDKVFESEFVMTIPPEIIKKDV